MPIGFLKKTKQPNELALKAAILVCGRGYVFDHARCVFTKNGVTIAPVGRERRGVSAMFYVLVDPNGKALSPAVLAGNSEEVDQAIEMLEAYHATLPRES